jgi:hypothetical protein
VVFSSTEEGLLSLVAENVPEAIADRSSLAVTAEYGDLVPTISETTQSEIPPSTAREGSLATTEDCSATCEGKI